jgi:hypothetical protein
MQAPMASMICPKCGFQQEKEPECRRCGIIVARYRPDAMPYSQGAYQPAIQAKAPPPSGIIRKCYLVFRWAVPAVLLLAVGLALHATPPPDVETSTRDTENANAKVRQFEESARGGLADTLVMDQSELNGWLGVNLAIRRENSEQKVLPTKTLAGAIDLAKKVTAAKAGELPIREGAHSSVRDVRIELHDDSLLAYAEFEALGMKLSLVLEGKLVVREGYLRLEPTRGKLGSLPLVAGTLHGATARIFESAENKERFHLPSYIHDIRIESGQLVVLTD